MPAEFPNIGLDNVLIGLNAATDLLEELKVQVSKIQDETREGIAETIQCYESCDASADSLAEAIQAGWLDVTFDPGGRTWNYLGWCPDCQKAHNEEECRLNAQHRPPTAQSLPTEGLPEPSSKPKKPLADRDPMYLPFPEDL